MRRLGKWFGRLMLLLILAGGVLWLFGPYEPADLSDQFDPAGVGGDVDAYLATQEARFDDITPGVEKRVVWAGAKGQKTPLSVVYIHGFSATSQEIRPVPDAVAEALGANLYFTRLAGHGRGGGALAGPSIADWVADLDQALAVGRRIGDRVLIIATSTGGTLAAIAAQDPERSADMAGFVLISPNFRIKNPAAVLLTWPAARLWLPWIVGTERSFTAANAEHERYWTPRYPVAALFPMAALVKAVRALDFDAVHVPTLFIYSPGDQVVDAAETARVTARWGGAVTVREVAPQAGMDPANHVIAGDILSPGRTPATVDLILDWVAENRVAP